MLAVEHKDRGEEDRRAFISLVQSKGFTLTAGLQDDFVFIRNNSDLALHARDHLTRRL